MADFEIGRNLVHAVDEFLDHRLVVVCFGEEIAALNVLANGFESGISLRAHFFRISQFRRKFLGAPPRAQQFVCLVHRVQLVENGLQAQRRNFGLIPRRILLHAHDMAALGLEQLFLNAEVGLENHVQLLRRFADRGDGRGALRTDHREDVG